MRSNLRAAPPPAASATSRSQLVEPPASPTVANPAGSVAPPEEPPEPLRYPFHEPLPAVRLGADAPAMRYANLHPADCRTELGKRDLPVQRDGRPTPGVATAYRFTDTIEGVHYVTAGKRSPYGIADCRLVLTMHDLAEVLAAHEVLLVRVDNMYRPHARLPGRRSRSQHAHALAMDVTQFELQSGQKLDVEDDWNGELGAPPCGPDAFVTEPTDSAIKLRNLVCDIARRGFFHHMLTPNYDAAHRDHLHLDIKRDAKTGKIE